jgi:hypothetical protein
MLSVSNKVKHSQTANSSRQTGSPAEVGNVEVNNSTDHGLLTADCQPLLIDLKDINGTRVSRLSTITNLVPLHFYPPIIQSKQLSHEEEPTTNPEASSRIIRSQIRIDHR